MNVTVIILVGDIGQQDSTRNVGGKVDGKRKVLAIAVTHLGDLQLVAANNIHADKEVPVHTLHTDMVHIVGLDIWFGKDSDGIWKLLSDNFPAVE